MAMWLSGEPKADKLLGESPIALMIGIVLDQQVPFERAFSAPYDLQQRLGVKLSAKKLAEMDPATVLEAFTTYRALHRFPGAMAERVQRLCQIVVDEWGGKPERIWETAKTGDELVQRLKGLPGFGDQKAKVFAALLGKQLGCRPKGWREATAPYGAEGTTMSVADISDATSLQEVRAHKRDMKAKAKAKQRSSPA
jgi:uncharacterized HhH-GPD family protein